MKKKDKNMKAKQKAKKPHKDLHHLTMCLKYTERNVKGDGTDLDEFFRSQAEKLRKEIEDLR